MKEGALEGGFLGDGPRHQNNNDTILVYLDDPYVAQGTIFCAKVMGTCTSEFLEFRG